MPFISHTPESLLPRSDSKNPTTTCHGITSTGRPCRRALPTSPSPSPSPRVSPSALRRGLAVVPADRDSNAAGGFCWQHQEQAERVGADGGAGRKKGTVGVRERTSVDTLVERLGLLRVGEGRLTEAGGRDRRVEGKGAAFVSARSKGGRECSVTTVERGSRIGAAGPAGPAEPAGKSRGKSRAEDKVVVSLFCCVRAVDPEDMPPARPRPQSQSHGNRAPRADRPPMKEAPTARRSVANGPVNTNPAKSASIKADSGRASQQATPGASTHLPPPRPTPRQPTPPAPHSRTQTLLSLIPESLPPHTTSALLSELAKPLPPPSPDDAGYIYIFRLTDTAAPSVPQPPTTTSLLLHTPPPRPHQPPPPHPPGTPTLLLKIGRASNVQRRLNEWARQCGHAPELVRYYPHDPHYPFPPPVLPITVTSSPFALPTTPTTTPTQRVPRKVPHASRVERLVHVELADRRAKRACGVCGRAHREWFEVEASAEGVRGVDEVVARWVKWGEGLGG